MRIWKPWVAPVCLTVLGLLSLPAPTASGEQPVAGRWSAVALDALARGNTACRPPGGGLVVGRSACDATALPGGWIQLDQVFDAPDRLTVVTIRVTAPGGSEHAIRSIRRDGRARILLDGRAIWEARAASDDGRGRYFAIAEREIFATLVIRQRKPHALRFETEPGVTWDIAGIELATDPGPRSIKGIAYSPYRDCQAPGGGRQPTRGDIDDDMVRILHSSTAIRTYSAIGANAEAVAAAESLGVPVYAGAWLDDVTGDAAELRGLIELSRRSRLAGYIVGNEFYLRHQNDGRRAVDYLLAQIRAFRSALPARHAPIMTADVDGVMFEWACDAGGIAIKGIKPEYAPILDAIDAVLVHIYPFWERRPVDGAAAFAAARYVAIRDFVRRRYPGKRVILGETGWPSAGAPQGAAAPGREAQRRYLAEFLQLADAHAIDYFYFDAFDEAWKIDEPGHVGQHWGYADATRAAKFDLSSVLVPPARFAPDAVPPGPAASICGGPIAPTSGGGAASAASPARDGEPIYSDWLSDDSKFVPVGWFGDTDKIDLFACDRSSPHGGEMAIRARFSPDGERGWGGVAWQDPASAWGTKSAGRDLRAADRVSFWVKGETGGEVVEFQAGGTGKAADAYRDTIRPARSSGPVVLSADWQRVAISLRGADRSRVVGPFTWVATRCHNPHPITFFLDDIRFEAGPLAASASQVARLPFHVYDDEGSGCGHFAPSGFMGDTGDLKLDIGSTESPFKGRTAIRVAYRPSAGRSRGWAGVYWQEPEHNWGTLDGGFDLSWATTLTFHARGRRGGELLEFVVGGVGKPGDPYRDSQPRWTTGPVRLARDWRPYAIDLRGRDLTRVVGGFAFALSADDNAAGAEFFLDEIAYEKR